MANPISVATEAAVKRLVQDQMIAGQVPGLLSVLIQLALITGIAIGVFICVVGVFIYAVYDVQEQMAVMEFQINTLRAAK